MSETQMIQDTSENLSNDLKKRRPGRPARTTEPPSVKIFPEEPATPPVKAQEFKGARIVHTSNIAEMSSEVHEERLRLAAELTELETNIQYCLSAGIEWLEVSEATLKHFNKGKIPAEGYSIYKNIRMCLKGGAEGIAQREKLTCHQVLFPDEGNMKIR